MRKKNNLVKVDVLDHDWSMEMIRKVEKDSDDYRTLSYIAGQYSIAGKCERNKLEWMRTKYMLGDY